MVAQPVSFPSSLRRVVDLPIERWLVEGGDSRLAIEPSKTLSRYGCAPWPRTAIAFGSCTASSIGERGFAAAWKTQMEVLGAHDVAAAGHEACRRIRECLRRVLRLPPDVAIALTPSGTDAELLMLALAAGDGLRPVVNIVVGPGEVGTGTPLAAAGRYFDAHLPSGARATVGMPVDAELAGRVETIAIDLRRADGSMYDEAEIDEVVSARVADAAARGEAVLLHVVSHGKTGMHAPSLACVERLRRRHADLVVVIDAAQGRFSRRGLLRVLAQGFATIVTGSKFFGGPPFSGALLVPMSLSPAFRRVDRLPEGFRDYFTAAEMPPGWQRIRRSLPAEPNYGLILRWSAALAEMQAYYDVPGDVRLRILRFFERAAPRLLAASPVLQLLPVSPAVEDSNFHRLLQSKTTVFSFRVRPCGAERDLGKGELLELQRLLNADGSARFSDRERRLRRRFHLGQPVDLGKAGYAMRVALGGVLVADVGSDRRLGATLDDRLGWLEDQIVGLRYEIESSVARWAPGVTR